METNKLKPDVILHKCEKCDGIGIIIQEIPTLLKPVTIQKTCLFCAGEGYI